MFSLRHASIRKAATRLIFSSKHPHILHHRRTFAYSPSTRQIQKWLIGGTFTLSTAFLYLHVFTAYFFCADITYGISMLPTLYSFGDWVIISKRYRRGRGVVVGDVISFQHPVGEEEYAIKRVIGMEGDFVLYNTPDKSEAMIQVPQGHCWVVGDNMKHSRDSRNFGPLPIALIHGKVLVRFSRFLPPDFSWIQHGLKPAQVDDELD